MCATWHRKSREKRQEDESVTFFPLMKLSWQRHRFRITTCRRILMVWQYCGAKSRGIPERRISFWAGSRGTWRRTRGRSRILWRCQSLEEPLSRRRSRSSCFLAHQTRRRSHHLRCAFPFLWKGRCISFLHFTNPIDALFAGTAVLRMCWAHVTSVAVAAAALSSPVFSSSSAPSSASCNSGNVDRMNTKVEIKMTPRDTKAATFNTREHMVSGDPMDRRLNLLTTDGRVERWGFA